MQLSHVRSITEESIEIPRDVYCDGRAAGKLLVNDIENHADVKLVLQI